jgi:hypothetical protein
MAMGQYLATGWQPNDNGLGPAFAFIAQHGHLALARKVPQGFPQHFSSVPENFFHGHLLWT